MKKCLKNLTDNERCDLLNEIERMNTLDELSYSLSSQDYNYIVKLRDGYLVKPYNSDNCVYVSEVDFI